MPNAFELQNVVYKNVLQKISFFIENKKITCIVGESGSGKTTILKLLNKMITPSSGKVLYNKKDISILDTVSLRRKVSMLPQVSVVFCGNVRDNLLAGLRFAEKNIQNISETKLLECLQFVKLNKSLDDRCEQFSGGEKQRLALARILLLKPDVFLLDEPTASLDEDTANFVIGKMVEHIKKTNRTMVMVTHSKQIVNTYADTVIEIKNGNIVAK